MKHASEAVADRVTFRSIAALLHPLAHKLEFLRGERNID